MPKHGFTEKWLSPRARMRRTGFTPMGYPLWTKSEDDTLRQLYPDYPAIRRALRRRSHYSIKGRAKTLGETKRKVAHYRWSADAVNRLRKIYPTSTRAEILAAFPGASWQQIKDKRKHIKVYRIRKPLMPTGYLALDNLRKRAREMNLSMTDLDAMAKTKFYFQKQGWRTGLNRRIVKRAIEALN
jgi:hypothetical protein